MLGAPKSIGKKREVLHRGYENIISSQFIKTESGAVNLNHAPPATTTAGTEKFHLRAGQNTKVCHPGALSPVTADLADFYPAPSTAFRQRTCIRRTLYPF